jgi:hypothetical protein
MGSNYSAAQTYCSAMHPDASVIVLRDWETLRFINATQNGVIGEFWIGLVQMNGAPEPAGGWFWTDQVPIGGNATYYRPTPIPWAPNEPDNGPPPGAQCARVQTSILGYRDSRCNDSYSIICEVHGKSYL